MTVPFMGLTGPGGALPQHYTSMIIERTHLRNKDFALQEFFDLFNHRAVSFFYRAWEKYRFPFSYERRMRDELRQDDLFTCCLLSLVGLGIEHLRDRFPFEDQTIVAYGGLFSSAMRTAVGLEQIVSDCFGLDTVVEQFIGQWLLLAPENQSCLPSRRNVFGQNLRLGDDAVVGTCAWDVQSRIRVVLGPLTCDEFVTLLPGGSRLQSIADLVRFYTGINRDFDLQLILKKEDVPVCRLHPPMTITNHALAGQHGCQRQNNATLIHAMLRFDFDSRYSNIVHHGTRSGGRSSHETCDFPHCRQHSGVTVANFVHVRIFTVNLRQPRLNPAVAYVTISKDLVGRQRHKSISSFSRSESCPSVNLKSLIGKLNTTCTRTLEAAAGICLSRTNYNVEIEHWLLKLLEGLPNDVLTILKFYSLSHSKDHGGCHTRSIDKLKTGNSSQPLLSQHVVDLAREAWVLGSIDYSGIQTRSGYLLLALLSDRSLSQLAAEMSPELTKIHPETLARDLTTILAESPEVVADFPLLHDPVQPAVGPGSGGGGPTQTPSLDQFTIDLTARAKSRQDRSGSWT